MRLGQQRARWLYAMLFASGATGLVFEVVWMRGFAIVLGGTQYAMAAVITAFMLGLAVGGALAARWLAKHPGLSTRRHLLIYGGLELFIGVYGLAFTPTLFLAQHDYLELVANAHAALGGAKVLFDFGLCVACMLLPTTAMGATLPIASMVLRRDRDTAAIYGSNTFGAAVGSLSASFVLIVTWGCLGAVYITTAINVLVCAGATWLARTLPESAAEPTSEREASRPKKRSRKRSHKAVLSPLVLLGLAFFSGLTTFSFEIVWNRSLTLFLGNRVYVTSVTLFVVLTCLGIGAGLGRKLLAERISAYKVLSTGYAVATVSIGVSLLYLERAFLADGSLPLRIIYAVLAIPVPAVALGLVFPMVLALPAAGSPRGVHVGRAYALNTLGSVLGALATGYVLISWLGSTRVILLNLSLLAACLLLLEAHRKNLRSALKRPAVIMSLGVGAAAWVIAYDKVVTTTDPAMTVAHAEDEHGVFTISYGEDGNLVVQNNTTPLVFRFGSRHTQWVQEGQAHFPALYAPSLDRVLVIGSGYGITAGTFGQYPDVGHVDAVEIVPLMVEHAEHFATGTYDYHRNPRIEVHITDGRHFLAMTDARYDVISINVEPYLPGTGGLFSREFYELVTTRLTKGGIVCQHLFGPDAHTLYHQFARYFPHVQAIPAYDNGATLIGSTEPLELKNLAAIESPQVASMLRRFRIDSEAGIRPILEKGDRIVERYRRMEPQFVNSDVHPVLEFRRAPGVATFYVSN